LPHHFTLLLLRVKLLPELLSQPFPRNFRSGFSGVQPLLELVGAQVKLAPGCLFFARARFFVVKIDDSGFKTGVKVTRRLQQLTLGRIRARFSVAQLLREVAALLHELKAAVVDGRQHALGGIARFNGLLELEPHRLDFRAGRGASGIGSGCEAVRGALFAPSCVCCCARICSRFIRDGARSYSSIQFTRKLVAAAYRGGKLGFQLRMFALELVATVAQLLNRAGLRLQLLQRRGSSGVLFVTRRLCQRERLLKLFDLRTCHAPSAPSRAHSYQQRRGVALADVAIDPADDCAHTLSPHLQRE
jgi:hypothetical protein